MCQATVLVDREVPERLDQVRLAVSKAIARLIRADLIVIDDIGMLPVAPDAAEALFRVVDAAYEKRSIALTSPRPSPPAPSTACCTTPINQRDQPGMHGAG